MHGDLSPPGQSAFSQASVRGGGGSVLAPGWMTGETMGRTATPGTQASVHVSEEGQGPCCWLQTTSASIWSPGATQRQQQCQGRWVWWGGWDESGTCLPSLDVGSWY